MTKKDRENRKINYEKPDLMDYNARLAAGGDLCNNGGSGVLECAIGTVAGNICSARISPGATCEMGVEGSV